MKILPELLLDSAGSVHFFMSKKLVFVYSSYSLWTEHELSTHYKYLEKIAFSLHEVNENVLLSFKGDDLMRESLKFCLLILGDLSRC